MSPFRFDAVIFDFDGVLVESVDVKGQAFADLFAEYGSEFQKQVLAYHHLHGGVSRFEKFRHFYRLLGKSLTPTEEKALGDRFSALVLEGVVSSAWVPGAQEFLEEFHRRLPLFIASGTPEEELREIIRRRNMEGFFKDSYGTPASKADIIRRILCEQELSPQRTLMVGDALSDLEGARSNGVPFIGRIPEHSRSPLVSERIESIPDLHSLRSILGNAR